MLELNVHLFIITIVAAAGMVTAALIRQIRVVMFRQSVQGLEERNGRLQHQHEQLTKEYEAIQERSRGVEDERRMVLGQIQELKRRVKQAKADNFDVIHEVGEPGPDRKLFTGTLGLAATLTIGKIVTQDSKLRGVRHILEVWAENQQEAMVIAKQAFPADNGFTILQLQPAAGPTKAAAVAAQ